LEKDTSDTVPVCVSFAAHARDCKKNKRILSLMALQEFYTQHQEHNLEFLVREIEKYFNKSFDYATEMRSFLIDIARDYKINNQEIKKLYNELGLNGKEEHKDENASIELSTVHGFKGAQSNVIIMPWCQQYDAQVGKDYDLEAERRLFYVAITRAMNKLYLCYSGPMPKFIKEMKL
jgi:DNA helicase-2/ATP-dependent DNA helicase PcrA